eukprot:GEMP01021743.1.p1 GENE.GEMP01021743.1~~GEMP01021743.1.p1  ORF type:complete len:352 (+),score=62.70 GEMP01021743.1:106-1161(+)
MWSRALHRAARSVASAHRASHSVRASIGTRQVGFAQNPIHWAHSVRSTFPTHGTRTFCAQAAARPSAQRSAPRDRNLKSILFGGATCLGLIAFGLPDDTAQSMAMWSEDANERSRDVLESILDNIVPPKPAPWLADLKTIHYPEHLPTLILDLDKVLVKLEYDRRNGWQVIKRPGADEFLKHMSYFYEIVIFSDEKDPVALDVMSRWGARFNAILHREFCKRQKKHYIKDISKLGRKLEKMVMVDHDPVAFSLQPENGIEIKPFNGDPDDRELSDLLDFLRALSNAASSGKDTREFIARFGGGDIDIGRRYRMYKEDREKVSGKIRGFGKAFGGGGGKAFAPSAAAPSRPF